MDNKNAKKSLTAQNVFVWTVGILLILTMLSTWMLSNLFAKYLTDGATSDSARVAAGGSLELWEHKATLEGGIYELLEGEENETHAFTYEKVIPGVDIPKDPFIRLDLENSEVDYELYVQVIKSDPFPDTVTFELTENWVLVDEAENIYRYKYTFDAGASDINDIKILKDDKLYVSEHYVGKDEDGDDITFSLTFNAYIKQVD